MNKKSTRNKPHRPADKTAAPDAATAPLDETTLAAPDQAGAGMATAPAQSTKMDKPHKPVTISITLPGNAAQLLEQLRQTHGTLDKKLKKSVLIRTALLALAETDPDRIAAIVAGLDVPQEAVAKARNSKKK